MSASAEPASAAPVGTLDVALEHARRLLRGDPALAAEQAAEILRVSPDQPMAALILGIARRALGDAKGALEVLEPLAARAPSWAAAQYELGIALGAAGQGEPAIAALGARSRSSRRCPMPGARSPIT